MRVYRPTRIDKKTGKVVKYRCWYLDYYDENGNRQSKKGFPDKRSTEELARKVDDEVRRKKAGLPVVAGDSSPPKEEPLSGLVQLYLDDLERQGSARSDLHYRESRRILTTLCEQCGWKVLTDVRPPSFAVFLAYMKGRGRAPRTLNRYHETLRAFLNWTVAHDYLKENPLRRVRMAKVGKAGRRRKRRTFTDEEFERLIRTCPADNRRLVYRVAAYSGLRRNEVRRLEKQDMDLSEPARPRWTLRPEITKNRQGGDLPMLPDCAELLLPMWRRLKEPTARVFKSIPPAVTFRKDLERARIARQDGEGRWLDFHSLRYYFCAKMARALPIQKVKTLMRHGSIKLTVDLYGELGLEDVAEDVWSLPRLEEKKGQE